MRIFLLSLFLLSFFNGYTQLVWHLQKDEPDIKIYTSHTSESAIKKIKAEIIFRSSMDLLVKEIMNVSSYKEWIYECSSSQLFKKINDSVLIYRHVTHAPWPFEDRDQVSKFSLTTEYKTGDIIITSQLLSNFPTVENCIRLKSSHASWILHNQGDGTVRASYYLSFDPGGSIPAWLINLFVTEGPYQSFKNLKKRIELN